jgi:hypothetical protein
MHERFKKIAGAAGHAQHWLFLADILVKLYWRQNICAKFKMEAH